MKHKFFREVSFSLVCENEVYMKLKMKFPSWLKVFSECT